MSIRQVQEKFKLLERDQIFYVPLIALVAFIAFGLGRLSILVELDDPALESVVLISESNEYDDRLTIPPEELTDDTVVASRNGARYYPLDCSAVERIAPENRIFFVDAQRAQAAGYTIAAAC